MDWLTASPWPMLALVFLGTGLLIGVAWYLERRAKQVYTTLIATGEPATATVLGAKDSGWRTNGRPHITFELEVRRVGHPPYRAKTRLQLERKWSPIPYGPGTVLRVRVDRDHPERIAIEGGEPVLGGGRVGPSPVIDFGSATMQSFTVGSVSSGDLYMVNGTSYASRDEMPVDVRAAFDQAMGSLAPEADPAERLRKLKGLYDEGLITAEEYAARRAAILESL